MALYCVILGLCAVSYGVGMIYLPAGIIAGGVFLAALGAVWIKGKNAALIPPETRRRT